MKQDGKKILSIFIRYSISVLIALPHLFIFYFIFTPLTIYPVYFLFKTFFEVSFISSTVILVSQTLPIEFIEACIAGSAYYFLLVLNLLTPGINAKTRIKMILLSFLAFLIVNIIRIFLLGWLLLSNPSLFNLAHIALWYMLSTVLVVLLWFAQVK